MKRNRGFTLVELLVVIGIIAILIAVLLPALNRARQQANMVKCQANMRSIGQAISIYTAQNKGVFPASYVGNPQYGDPTHAFRWTSLLLSTLSGKYGATWTDSAVSGTDTAKGREMFFCPEVSGDAGKLNQSGLTHYFAHPRLIPDTGISNERETATASGFGGWHDPFYYKQSKVKRASETAIVFEGALQFNASTGEYGVAYDDPSATNIDNFAFGGGGTKTRLLESNIAATGRSRDDSIDMTGTPGIANTDGSTDAGGNTTGYANTYNIRFRHQKNTAMNALMVDGHVESFAFNPKLPPADKTVTTLKLKNICVPNP